jgi:hypothetical protein
MLLEVAQESSEFWDNSTALRTRLSEGLLIRIIMRIEKTGPL